MAADCAFEIKTPTRLAKQFGASIYASAREFGRTHHRACVVHVLEPIELVDGCRARRRPTHRTVGAVCQAVRPSIRERDHARSSVGARAAGSAQGDAAHLGVTHDLNGVQHEYVVEAFDTTYNVLILAYMIPVSGVILPTGFATTAAVVAEGTKGTLSRNPLSAMLNNDILGTKQALRERGCP